MIFTKKERVMEKLYSFESSRREFMTKIIPACAVTCFGVGYAFSLTKSDTTSLIQEAKHKFDTELDKKLTYRQVLAMQHSRFIDLTIALEKEMGKDKLIEFLKKFTTERLLKIGQNQAKRSPDNSFKTYVNTFRSPQYEKTLTMEIVEDTEKAFELKVTECLWAETYLKSKAGDIGYAAVCYGDYAWAEGFNPKIKLIRDKTLMQGNECCNHRYSWLG